MYEFYELESLGNNMKIQILDTKQENQATCYLVKLKLYEYLENLPENYKDWDIQRGIVTNKYLDNILDTIVKKKHIPPMVLVAEDFQVDTAETNNFRILDGLQRTYRLKTIYNSNKLINELSGENELAGNTAISITRKFKDRIIKSNSSPSIVRKLINIYGGTIQNNRDLFSSEQWFEIWVNLDINEQVRKMLLLNAGHKSVSNKHQIEIIFHNYLKELEHHIDNDFKVLKEKDVSSISSSKSREIGQFHFSNIITTMLSLLDRKPVTVNATFLNEVQEYQEANDYYSLEFSDMQGLCQLLLDSDKALHAYYGGIATQWFGREVVLNGIFGAIGKYSDSEKIHLDDAFNHAKIIFTDRSESLNVSDFDEARKSLSLSKVNIGSATKKAVFDGFFSLLTGDRDRINWNNIFGGANE